MDPDPAPSGPTTGRDDILFQAELSPHRSLSPRGFAILMAGLCAVSFAAGVTFVTMGAWPVFGFFGLDVLLLYWAFKASYRSGNLREIVRLTEDELEVRRIHPSGGTKRWRFQPHWLRIDIDEPPEHHSQLTLRSHGRSLTIGTFLTPTERVEVAHALRDAIARGTTPARA